MSTVRPVDAGIDLQVTGMTCASCANRIERKLNRLPGTTATVNYATATAHVSASAVALPELIAAVAAAGYGAAPVAEEPADEDGGPVARLVAAAALAVPVVLISMIPALHVPGWPWAVIVLSAPVVTWSAWPFHRAAAVNMRHGAVTMDTLISLGVIAATVWSVVTVVAGLGMPYLEVAAVVTSFLLAARVAEARARRRSGAAIRALAALGAKEATLLRGDVEQRVAASTLVPGDRVVVRPGETLPADGVVADGRSAIDAALLTGESVPVEVGPGDRVTGGTIDVGGRLVVEVTRVGADTELARIARLVTEAQQGKAAAQRRADRVSAVFVPVVIVLAAAAGLGWWLAGQPQTAIVAAVTTLIIACPCALGLATPTALLVGTGRGAQLGILIRGPQALERTRAVDTVVLDKTGTLTAGRMTLDGDVPDETLALAAAVEHGSEHPIGRAIVRAAEERGLRLPPVDGFAAEPGGGVRAVVDGRDVAVGRAAWLGVSPPETALAAEARGATAVLLAVDGRPAGVLVVADTVKPAAAEAVARLRALRLDPVLLTGDNAGAARAVAAAAGIDEVHAGATPQGKLERIRALQAAGRTVAMVGDGVNDAAALAAADLGIAMGGGTDAAAAAADLTLVRDDVLAIPDAVRLARRTLGTIRGNLFWAFAYNVVALPVAMAGLLNPMIAGAAMAASSVLVVGNSLRLLRFR